MQFGKLRVVVLLGGQARFFFGGGSAENLVDRELRVLGLLVFHKAVFQDVLPRRVYHLERRLVVVGAVALVSPRICHLSNSARFFFGQGRGDHFFRRLSPLLVDLLAKLLRDVLLGNTSSRSANCVCVEFT